MASSQYNSVYDMYKGNANKNTNAPQGNAPSANAPDPNEPDPNAPIYSMYGNNQFGSPMLPNQKPSFNSVYDIYGQGKMNDFSAGAGKTPASPLEKPNQNPTVGNVAKPFVPSNPYVPRAPSVPEVSQVKDSGGIGGESPTPPNYNAGSQPGAPGTQGLPAPPSSPPPPVPPEPVDTSDDGGGGGGGGSGSGGGGGGGGGGPKGGSKGGSKGDTPMDNPSSPSGPFGAVGGRGSGGGGGVYEPPLNEFVGEGPAGGIGSDIPGAPTDSPMTKEEALANGYLDPVDGVSPVPLYTEWDGEKMIIHWSDGYSEPSHAFGGKGRQFKDKATSPADGSPRSEPQPADPANNYDGAGDPNAQNYGKDLFGSGKGFGSGGAWV